MSLLTRLANSRRGWPKYALLAGLCLSTVGISLYASHRQMVLSDEVLGQHQAWSNRLARYGRFSQLAVAISAPCNEVFDSGDLGTELARTRRARKAFDAEMDSARLELAHVRRGVSRSLLLKDLEAVGKATDDMMVDVRRTFASFDVGTPPDVAVINGHLDHINEELKRLGRHAREAEGLESRELLGASAFLQQLASVILVMASVLVVLIGVIVRGMAKRAAADGQDPERILAAVKESEARMREVLDAAPDPVITLDESGRITGWNAHAEEAFGWTSDEIRGSKFSEIVIAPRHRATVDQGLLRFLETGDTAILNRRLDITALEHDGRELPIELAIVPVRTGEATIFTAFLRDLTEPRRANDQIRRLSLVASKTASGVIITDAVGRTEWVNDAFVRISGHALEDLRDQAAVAVLRGPHTESVDIERMVDAFRSGTGFRVELANQTPDGRPYWVEVEATPIFDDGGILSQFIAIVTDISERKRVEAALRESEARTRAIVEGAVDGIITFDNHGTITNLNPSSERIFGYRPGELIGKPVRILMPGLGQMAAGHDPGSELEVGPLSVTASGRRRNGSAFPIELSISEVRLDGCRMWTCIVRDITRRKQLEALRVGQNRVLELLASGAPLAGALTELIHIVEEQQPGIVCMVPVLHPGQTRLRVAASPSLPDDLARAVERVEIGPSACSWGAATYLKQRVVVEDTANHPLWSGFHRHALDFGLRSSWAEPILSASGQALGAFVAFRRRVHSPGAAELELASFAAHIAAIAIERTRAPEALRAYTLELEEAVSPAG